MRRIRYENWMEKRRSFVAVRARTGYKRGARRRPRDPEERELLMRMDQARLERWEKEGKLVKLGLRRWRFVPDAFL